MRAAQVREAQSMVRGRSVTSAGFDSLLAAAAAADAGPVQPVSSTTSTTTSTTTTSTSSLVPPPLQMPAPLSRRHSYSSTGSMHAGTDSSSSRAVDALPPLPPRGSVDTEGEVPGGASSGSERRRRLSSQSSFYSKLRPPGYYQVSCMSYSCYTLCIAAPSSAELVECLSEWQQAHVAAPARAPEAANPSTCVHCALRWCIYGACDCYLCIYADILLNIHVRVLP
jgi:hypothetical protein